MSETKNPPKDDPKAKEKKETSGSDTVNLTEEELRKISGGAAVGSGIKPPPHP